MPKTILKLHANGNFETVGTPLIQDNNTYSFTENQIIAPKIIEYPPIGYRNYFVEKTSVSGFINVYPEDGQIGVNPPNEHDRTSDYIDVEGWGSATIRIRYKGMNNSYRAWANVSFYTILKEFHSYAFDDYVGQNPSLGDYIFVFEVPVSIKYLRVSTNYYDNPNVDVKISVEKGLVDIAKHYLSFEDMPTWVKDTGQPISFFREGIVIKGYLIQT